MQTALVYWPATGEAHRVTTVLAPSVFASPWMHAFAVKKPASGEEQLEKLVSLPRTVPLPCTHTLLTYWLAEGSAQTPQVTFVVELPMTVTYWLELQVVQAVQLEALSVVL